MPTDPNLQYKSVQEEEEEATDIQASPTSSSFSLPLLDIPSLEEGGDSLHLLPSYTTTPSAHQGLWSYLRIWGLPAFSRRVSLALLELFLVCLVLVPIALLLRAKAAPSEESYKGLNMNPKGLSPPLLTNGSIPTPPPLSPLYPLANSTGEPANVFLDGHAHTLESDGDLGPEQLVDWAVAHGLNAIVISDHNEVAAVEPATRYAREHYSDQVIIIPGQEYSCCRIHMNLLNVTELIEPTSPWPTDEELKRVVDQVHDLGGLVVVNHPAWSLRTTSPYQEATLPDHPSLETLLDMGVDGIEVVNERVYDPVAHAFQMRHGDKLFALTGSDIHAPVGAYTWTGVHVKNLTLDAVLEELRHRRTSIHLDAAGTRSRVYPLRSWGSAWFEPIRRVAHFASQLLEHDRGMYSFQGSFCHREIYRPQWTILLALMVYVILGMSLWLALRTCILRRLRSWRARRFWCITR
ncbi:MAG: Polymerase/histidinol phosphatase-like protein [Piptocephalis tieghemiana]|nr:MAG: Polymerase/histidinol phosphatase-like protein [Piptocephalis tieghemiana]